MRLLKSVVVAGLVAFTAVAAEAQIQTPDTASTAVNGAYSALDLQIPRGIPMSTRSGMARALADVDRKDPALAGILCWEQYPWVHSPRDPCCFICPHCKFGVKRCERLRLRRLLLIINLRRRAGSRFDRSPG
jgi:hypothetical protein